MQMNCFGSKTSPDGSIPSSLHLTASRRKKQEKSTRRLFLRLWFISATAAIDYPSVSSGLHRNSVSGSMLNPGFTSHPFLSIPLHNFPIMEKFLFFPLGQTLPAGHASKRTEDLSTSAIAHISDHFSNSRKTRNINHGAASFLPASAPQQTSLLLRPASWAASGILIAGWGQWSERSFFPLPRWPRGFKRTLEAFNWMNTSVIHWS